MPQDGAGGFLVCGISRRAMRPRLRRLVHFLDRLEINALLVAPDQNTWFGHRDHALLLLVVQTGLRLSELTGLQRMTWPWAREPMYAAWAKGAKSDAHRSPRQQWRCTAWLRRVLRLARLLDLLRSSFVLASSIVSLPVLHNGLPQRCPSLSGGGGETSQEK